MNTTKYVSDFFGYPLRNHRYFDFFNVKLTQDTTVFVDPGLIRVGRDKWSKLAQAVIDSFFASLASAYAAGKSDSVLLNLFSHFHEPNYTMLGYGDYWNGKAGTPEGFLDVFQEVKELSDYDILLQDLADFKLCLYGLGNDKLSDLITNLLLEILNEFTLEKYYECGLPLRYVQKPPVEPYYWDLKANINGAWKQFFGKMLVVNERPLLLLPKQWIRSEIYGGPKVFVSQILLKNLQEQYFINEGIILSKKDLRKNIGYSDMVLTRRELQNNPESLTEYHEFLNSKYPQLIPSDTDLDKIAGITEEDSVV